MDYHKFQETILKQIKDYLPEQYREAQIDIREVSKNNNLKLDGLNIRLPDENVTTTIYLNHYYKDYQSGTDVEKIMGGIAELRQTQGVKQNLLVEDLLDFDKVKDKIVFQVIGADANKERLSNIPHRKENDMAIVYRIMAAKGDEGIATAQISKAMMNQMGVDENTLYQVALKNTQREFPMTFSSMNEVMLDILQHDFMDIEALPGGDEMKEVLMGLLAEQEDGLQKDGMDLYVLSNESKISGAAALFYPGVQEQIAQQLNGDYFVLPSSIHEVLVVPDNGNISFQELRSMVNEVNATQVAPNEVLTGEVYSYDRDNQTLMVAGERLKQLKPSILDSLKEKPEEKEKKIPEKKGRASDMEL